jgi:putative acyl-CoA dehydrogenase
MVGEEGRGVRTIIEMVNHTRLDCVIGSAALMRQAVAQATHHTAHRSAFGRLLSEQPLMVNVLADLAVESEATTVLMMRLAGAFDRASDPEQAAFRRLALAVAKYWTCKRAIAVVSEALECHGGNGYVEESIMPRLYREAPLNSIWEGSGNVNALDVLRAMAREPEAVTAFVNEVEQARGSDPRLDDAVAELKRQLSDPTDAEARARRIVELMAIVLEASVLIRHGDPAVAEAFCASRLDSGGGRSFGTLPPSSALAGIVRRHQPQI